MANFFTLTLDMTGPANPSISLESGATYATTELIQASISTSDSTATGYQMKIWGDIDLEWAKANGIVSGVAVDTQEADALWISYTTSKQLQLSATGGSKNVYLKIRDDVHNVSSQVSSSIILDTNLPTVNITGPDVSKISKQSGKNIASFSFQVSEEFVEYKVKVVSSSGATHDTGVQIATTNGSTNMNGTGSFPANTPINCTINGADLDVASPGDGDKIIKIFVKDSANQWSAS